MAPTTLGKLVARYGSYSCNVDDYNYDGNYGYCNSAWDRWGRWVLLACIIVFALFVALAFSCINSRRRRRAGMAPRYGTGWLAGKTPDGHNGPAYTGYNNQGYNQGYNNAAPPYSPPVNQQYTGQTFNSNDGYYGQQHGQQNGFELQQPQNSYAPPRGGEPVYAAPEGPPPSKEHRDGIIR